MKQPLRITVDATCSLGYIEYRDEGEWVCTRRLLRRKDGTVAIYRNNQRRDEPTGVHVDLTDNDEVVALEIISVDDPGFVAIARDYAIQHGLAFPDDLRAAAARDPAA
jgi:hypothetical protein